MALTTQEQRLLIEYGQIFNISPPQYEGQEEEAYYILVMLYGLFAIDDKYDRQKYRDAILNETKNKFGQTGPFFGRVIRTISFHISQKNWFSPRESNTDLIQTFKYLLIGITALSLLGVSPTLGSIRRGAEESIRKGTVRAGIDRARQRLLQGAGSGVVEALVSKIGTRFPIGAALVAIGIIAFYAMEAKMNNIRETLTERFEAGLATEEELDEISNANFSDVMQEAFGGYWE